jgi:hypothetical protein
MTKRTLFLPCASALLAAGVVHLVGCGGPGEPAADPAPAQQALAALAACGLDDGSIDADAHLHACDPQDVKKTTICHIPPGNPANAHTICVGNAAVSHHIKNHGDYVGACKSETPCPPPPPASGGAGGGGSSGTAGGGSSGTGGVTGAGGSPAPVCPDGQAVCGADPAQCPAEVGNCTNGCCVPWSPV